MGLRVQIPQRRSIFADIAPILLQLIQLREAGQKERGRERFQQEQLSLLRQQALTARQLGERRLGLEERRLEREPQPGAIGEQARFNALLAVRGQLVSVSRGPFLAKLERFRERLDAANDLINRGVETENKKLIERGRTLVRELGQRPTPDPLDPRIADLDRAIFKEFGITLEKPEAEEVEAPARREALAGLVDISRPSAFAGELGEFFEEQPTPDRVSRLGGPLTAGRGGIRGRPEEVPGQAPAGIRRRGGAFPRAEIPPPSLVPAPGQFEPPGGQRFAPPLAGLLDPGQLEFTPAVPEPGAVDAGVRFPPGPQAPAPAGRLGALGGQPSPIAAERAGEIQALAGSRAGEALQPEAFGAFAADPARAAGNLDPTAVLGLIAAIRGGRQPEAGQAQSIISTLAAQPDLIPTEGLDPEGVRLVRGLVFELGRTPLPDIRFPQGPAEFGGQPFERPEGLRQPGGRLGILGGAPISRR